MKVKRFFTALILLLFTIIAISQDNVIDASIISSDETTIKILNSFPDSFPNISVVFEAEKNNAPIWDLSAEKLQIYEDEKLCEIIGLEPISKNEQINISIVLDHSSSMKRDRLSNLYPMKEYNPSPLESAKSAIKKFIAEFDKDKDFISLIGFSNTITTRIPLTQDIDFLLHNLEKIVTTNRTALNDAMYEGIVALENAKGINIAIVLTDGKDNASKKNIKDVIGVAQENRIPIFIIGLGMVEEIALKQIAKGTKGAFYYTENSN